MARKRTPKGSGARRQDEAAGSAAAGTTGSSGAVNRTPAITGGASGRGLASGKATGRSAAPKRPPAGRPSQKAIPDAVANRMARRIAIATGIPTLMGMGVFIASYLLVSRGILDIQPGATLVASGACFLLGLVGLSYGVLSSSWEEAPGSLLGREQIGLNISRVRDSIRAMRESGSQG